MQMKVVGHMEDMSGQESDLGSLDDIPYEGLPSI